MTNENTSSTGDGPSKNALKKAQKAAEKAAKKAEHKAQNAAAKGGGEEEEGEGEDISKDLYGNLPMNRSEEKRPVTHTPLANLDRTLASHTITVRARLHTSRGKGKQVFFVMRSQASTVQCVLAVGENVSKQMVKFVCNIPKESIIDVEGKVVATEQKVESCSIQDVELHATKVFVVSGSLPRLPLQVLELWWANTLSLSEVFRLARLPFPDMHCAAVRLLTALAALPWGQRLILGEPGLMEYILDRSTESDKQGMEAKWTLVETIVKSPSALSTFPEEHLSRLEKYFRQGPFYVEAQLEVALEGQD